MKFEIKVALLTAMIIGIAIVGPGFCVTHSAIRPSPDAVAEAHLTRRSVVKLHTIHGVITLPGTANSWDQVEHAVFVADGIADVQVVNNEVPWRISVE